MQYFCDGLDLYDVKKFIWNYTRLVKYKRVEGTVALRIQGIGLRRAADRKVKIRKDMTYSRGTSKIQFQRNKGN